MNFKNESQHPPSLYITPTIMLLLLASCTHFEKNKSHQQIPDSNIAHGKELAAKYCQSCHMLPDPALLDAKSWEQGVLPGMGPRLGIFYYNQREYPSSRYDAELDSGYYPKQPVMSFEDWQNIIDYYTAISPDTLGKQQRKYATKKSDSLFITVIPNVKNDLPATCLVKIDTTVSPAQLFTADALSAVLSRYDNHLLPTGFLKTRSPVVDLEMKNREMLTCNIGIMRPNNGKSGNANRLQLTDTAIVQMDTAALFNRLARPVQINSADFNKDGKTDYLVCEFGNLTGALSWMENMGNEKYTRHVILGLPGAIKAYITDVNNDGLPDIWVLFAQAEEGIFLFTNKGNGKFSREELLRFEPIFGSSYFELADFDKDGHPDILYTCGDNADYSPVLKPYHGVYVYLNDGSNHFKQAYFFPMYGCFKAVARDFDGDGDLDIAAISFFGDYAHHPEESFIYLQNKGGLDYQQWSVPATNYGRWLTMDAGDIDGDGKPDIILGNFSVAPATLALSETWRKESPFIVLKNNIQNNKK